LTKVKKKITLIRSKNKEHPMFIADRMSKIDSSGIRKVFDLGAKLKNPVNLSIGQPDFTVPDVIKQASIRAIEEDKNRYTLTQGIPELRSMVKNIYEDKYNFKAEKALITSGVSGGLILALMALINKGDEVLIPDPYFVMYKHLVNLIEGVPVFYNTYPDFQISEKELVSKITDKTKVILVNSPNNPTGKILSENELKMIADIAEKKNIFIISDEIYDNFSYDASYHSISEYTNNVLILNGFSKSVAITGWRVGYALGPDILINEMIKLQQYSFVCAPSMAQYALLEYNKVDTDTILKEYREKRDIIYNGLKDKFDLIKPDGAFYIFPKIPGNYNSATEFVEKAIENNVLIIPGNVFSEKDTNFRISFAATNETLQKGIEILNRLA